MPTIAIRGRYPPPIKRCANNQTLMKKFWLFVALCALSVACSECRLQPDPPFVRDIVMPTARFDAGDEVTVKGVGFAVDDDIFVRRIDPSTQTQTTLRAEVTARTAESISFIMPAGYAAGSVEVLLFRGGEPMALGSIEVSNGLPPATASLYGLGRNEAGEFIISDIDPSTGAVSEKVVCARALDGAVTGVTTNRIFGIDRTDGNTAISGYDFTLRRHLAVECDEEISNCIIGMNGTTLLPMRMESNFRIKLIACTVSATRSKLPQKYYLTGLNIPDDVAAAEFADNRFVYLGKSSFLTKMSVTTADGGKYVALASLDIPSYSWTLGEPIDDADDILLIFSPVTPCVVTVSGGRSTVWRIPESTLKPMIGEVLGHIEGKALSSAYNESTKGIYLLNETDGKRKIGEFMPADGSYKELCEVPNDMEQIISVR